MSRDMVCVRRGVAMDHRESQRKMFSMLIPLQDQRWLFVNWFTNKLWIVDRQEKTRLVKETSIKNICISTEKPTVNCCIVHITKIINNLKLIVYFIANLFILLD